MADEGFRQRWSRRKAQARAPVEELAPEPPEEQAEASPAPAAQPPATPPDAGALDDADRAVDLDALPDIDSLTYESDFTVFMRKGVPAELRKRALQRLWRSNPTLANLDGLVEYGGDYTKLGTTKQIVRTAYQVGRGMLAQIEPRAEPPAAEVASAPAPADASLPAPTLDEPDVNELPAVIATDRSEDGARSAGADQPEGTGAQPGTKPRPLPRRG
jgi:hypothetical protein